MLGIVTGEMEPWYNTWCNVTCIWGCKARLVECEEGFKEIACEDGIWWNWSGSVRRLHWNGLNIWVKTKILAITGNCVKFSVSISFFSLVCVCVCVCLWLANLIYFTRKLHYCVPNFSYHKFLSCSKIWGSHSGVLGDQTTGMRRIKTFRSTTDNIHDGGPIIL